MGLILVKAKGSGLKDRRRPLGIGLPMHHVQLRTLWCQTKALQIPEIALFHHGKFDLPFPLAPILFPRAGTIAGRMRPISPPSRTAGCIPARGGYSPAAIADLIAPRRGGRAVEGARLESVFTGNRVGGSNPPPSAISTPERDKLSGDCLGRVRLKRRS